MPLHDLATHRTPIHELRPHPNNPRNGDTSAIASSLTVNGQYRPIVVARGGVILAGNHTYAAAMELGWSHIATVQLDLDPVSPEALRIMAADNRTADLGNYDEGLLLDLLRELDTTVGLDGSGYDPDALDHLAHQLAVDDLPGLPKGRVPGNRGELTLDLIWSGQDIYTSLLAHLAGWTQGLISTCLPDAWEKFARVCETFREQPRLTFVDNEWHGYDHAVHLNAVAAHTPKYATVRDIMTRQQCADAGVDYYPLGDVLAMGTQLAEAGAENVILIPKFDCLADLPRELGGARVVLGYSVPSSYGRTELDPELFRGWPVHLLGGSWDSQRSLCALLGVDVVSLDNNYLFKQGKFGMVQNGGAGQLSMFDVLDGTRIYRGMPLVATFLSQLACFSDAVSWGGAAAPDDLPELGEAPLPVARPGEEEGPQ